MKVILLKNVRNVGKKDDVRDVADGFAANFLLPQSLAVMATLEQVTVLEKTKQEHTARELQEEAALDEKIRSLSGARIEMAVRATPKGGLFKSITTADISRVLKDQKDMNIPATSIVLHEPIKTTGEYAITLQSKNAQVEITFSVVPNF